MIDAEFSQWLLIKYNNKIDMSHNNNARPSIITFCNIFKKKYIGKHKHRCFIF